MKGKDLFLLDSSIWIDIERGKLNTIEKARPLIESNKVCLCDLIVAELLRGARTQTDFDGLKLRLCSFPIYTGNWERIAQLAFDVQKAGFSPPLADLYIADCSIQNKKTLITSDKHFKNIYKVRKFKLEFWD